ncbi:MAG: hypothetical protein QXS02_03605 [Candidatus Thermoplasmatota archaeon]
MIEDELEMEEVSRLFLEGKDSFKPEEKLALFMQRFNLDWDTVESMPAFDEHRKALFPQTPRLKEK